MSKLAHSNEETMRIIEENDERHLSEARVDRKELTPTRIGYVAGVAHYEDPIQGDEAPLMVMKDGELVHTEYWELSDADENA